MSEQHSEKTTRRELGSRAAMGVGLLLAYGTLAVQGLLFLMPRRRKPPTQRIFVGSLSQFSPDEVRTLHDLEGRAILVRRTAEGLEAFSSVCPHLGCQVHWQPEERTFLCPCHRGVFTADGEAIAGPPADAGQRLSQVPLTVDADSGAVYLEVRVPGKGVRS
jgi:Rieske Fe-S protein